MTDLFGSDATQRRENYLNALAYGILVPSFEGMTSEERLWLLNRFHAMGYDLHWLEDDTWFMSDDEVRETPIEGATAQWQGSLRYLFTVAADRADGHDAR